MNYVKCKVVMLPTEKAPKNWKIGELLLDGTSLFLNKTIRSNKTNNVAIPQHLYILSNEEIKEGDWVIMQTVWGKLLDNSKKKPLKVLNQDKTDYLIAEQESPTKWKGNVSKDDCLKIIASTDESLGLPIPPDDFIKKYCELGGIEEVFVEFKNVTETYSVGHGEAIDFVNKIKVSSDNTITIKPVKNSWNREEVEAILRNFNEDKPGVFNVTNWIKENL